MSASSDRGGCCLIEHESRDKEMKESSEEILCSVVLPDDVVVEILSCLPLKPFFRFKCVSKTWLVLSSHASRLNKHLRSTLLGSFHQNSNPSPFFNNRFGFTNISGGVDEIDATLSAFRHNMDFRIMDCCNGLLLVKRWSIGPMIFPLADIYVYNPATRKLTIVEMLPRLLYLPDNVYETLSLAFDPQDRPRFHIIFFMHSCDGDTCANAFLTFSSDSGRWKSRGNLECSLRIADGTKGTFFGGRVYRVTTRHEIMSIDPVDNSYLVTKFDFPGLSENGKSEVGQSQGLLHFMFVNEFRKMSIWVSENGDAQNWILKHQLSFEGPYESSVLLFGNIKLHPGEDVIFVHEEGNECIRSIDLTNGELNGIYTLPFERSCSFWLYMPCFWECGRRTVYPLMV